MTRIGSNLLKLKKRNRVYIKEYIYRHAPVTRLEIADALGLTLPTITTSVAAMLEDGILLEESLPKGMDYHPQAGRKPTLVRFRPDAAFAMGVELGPHRTTLRVTTLLGQTVLQKTAPLFNGDYEELLTFLKQLIDDARRELTQDQPLCGVGIGLPGFVESREGVIRKIKPSSWNNKNLAKDLGLQIGLPVLIDNNVRMRAANEALFATRQRPELFAYFYMSKGVACPLTFRDHIIEGSTAGAGELGHTIIIPNGPVCPVCGHAGCLDAVASETAILVACTKALLQKKAPLLAQLCDSGTPNMQQILHAQELGDRAVCEILDRVVELLGISLANVVNLMNPKLVLVDSYLMNSIPNQRLLTQTATAHFYGINGEEVQIEFLPFDDYRGASGGAASVLRRYFLEQ